MLSTQDVKNFIENYPTCKFLTITLKPKIYKYSSITQLELTNYTVFEILQNTSDKYVCIAEHTQVGNVHYHALVYHQQSFQLVSTLNKLKKCKYIGFIQTNGKPIEEITKCSEYMVKSLEENKKLFNAVRGNKPKFIMTNDLWKILFNN